MLHRLREQAKGATRFFVAVHESLAGPSRKPRPSAAAAAFWGAPVAEVTRPTPDGCDSLTQPTVAPFARECHRRKQGQLSHPGEADEGRYFRASGHEYGRWPEEGHDAVTRRGRRAPLRP
jgi:hypothetical protein